MADNDTIHIAFESLGQYSSNNFPKEWNEADSDAFVSVCKSLNSTFEKPFENLNEDLLKLFSYTCSGNLSPMVSVIGNRPRSKLWKIMLYIVSSIIVHRRDCSTRNYQSMHGQIPSHRAVLLF